MLKRKLPLRLGLKFVSVRTLLKIQVFKELPHSQYEGKAIRMIFNPKRFVLWGPRQELPGKAWRCLQLEAYFNP